MGERGGWERGKTAERLKEGWERGRLGREVMLGERGDEKILCRLGVGSRD